MEGDSITIRDSEFKGSEEHLIDIFDIKVCISPSILFFLKFSYIIYTYISLHHLALKG